MFFEKEIGGEFKISLNSLFQPKLTELDSNKLYFLSGRDCLRQIIKTLNLNHNSVVLLPAYLCESILKPFKEHKIKIKFYKINKDLAINLKDIKQKSKKNISAILIIHYFGFIQKDLAKIRKLCNERGIILIEDLVQAYLSAHKPLGDFYFNSYRKLFFLPDGAFVGGKISQIKSIKSDAPLNFLFTRFLVGFLKNFWFLSKICRKLYLKAERELMDKQQKPAEMSCLSKYILKRIDEKNLIKKRRLNYSYLLNKLKGGDTIKLLFSKLPTGVCPLGFPILSKKRDFIKKLLIKNKIYPPIHWNLPKCIDNKRFKDAVSLSKQILTIPLDQRYNEQDMAKVVEVLNGVI